MHGIFGLSIITTSYLSFQWLIVVLQFLLHGQIAKMLPKMSR